MEIRFVDIFVVRISFPAIHSKDRREFVTTNTLLAAIASAAKNGLMKPATASGIATPL